MLLDVPAGRDEPKKATVLQKMPVRVQPHDECVRAWKVDRVRHLSTRQICAATVRGEGTGVCHGDSGGPLQCQLNGQWYLAGVTSFGKYCGSASHPSVFARVNAVLQWIKQITALRTRR